MERLAGAGTSQLDDLRPPKGRPLNSPGRGTRTTDVRGLAHPARPAGPAGQWSRSCARDGCDYGFLTENRQRRYCSKRCRRIVEKARAGRQTRISELLSFRCAAPHCDQVFLPASEAHQYCSSRCRKRAHRTNSDLSPSVCGWCANLLPTSKTRRRRYCGATCRQRAARAARGQAE